MRAGRQWSWIYIKRFIPFRSCYFYWDKDPYLADVEFINRQIPVRFKRGEFSHPEYHFRGIIIYCWKRDEAKVEEALNALDERMRKVDPNYEEFLRKWHELGIKMAKQSGILVSQE